MANANEPDKNKPAPGELAASADLGSSISDVWSVMEVNGDSGWNIPDAVANAPAEPQETLQLQPTPADEPTPELAPEPHEPPDAPAPPAPQDLLAAADDPEAHDDPTPSNTPPQPHAAASGDFDAFDLAAQPLPDGGAMDLAALAASTSHAEPEPTPPAPARYDDDEDDDIPPLGSLLPPAPVEEPDLPAAPTPFIMPEIKVGKTQDVLTLNMAPAQVVRGPGPNWGMIGIIGGAVALIALIIGVGVYIIQTDPPPAMDNNAAATLAANSSNNATVAAPPEVAAEEKKEDGEGWVGEAPEPPKGEAEARAEGEEKGAQPVQTVAQSRKKNQDTAAARRRAPAAGGNATPPPVRGGGNLVLSCPGKSDVTVDGRPVGTTPTRVSVAPGPHKITMTRKADGRKWAAKVQSEKGKDTPVQCRFK